MNFTISHKNLALKVAYGWSLMQANDPGNLNVPIGLKPGLTSRTFNWASGISSFDSSFYSYIDLIMHEQLETTLLVPVLKLTSSGHEYVFGDENIKDFVICERPLNDGYCISQAGIAEKGFNKKTDKTKGKGLLPHDCVQSCKSENKEVRILLVTKM
jgi:hypothetical protein